MGSEWWRPSLLQFLEQVEKISRSHIKKSLIQQGHGIPQVLVTAINSEWQSECNSLFANLKAIFENRLQKEIPWGTLNHYLTAKFEEQRALPDELVADFLHRLPTETIQQHPEQHQRSILSVPLEQ